MRVRLLAVAIAVAAAPLPAQAATYEIVSAARGPGSLATYYPHTAISGNGRYVAYHTVHNPASPALDLPVPCCLEGVPKTTEELWLADLATRKQVKVMTGDCCINALSLSRDGRYLVFESFAKR